METAIVYYRILPRGIMLECPSIILHNGREITLEGHTVAHRLRETALWSTDTPRADQYVKQVTISPNDRSRIIVVLFDHANWDLIRDRVRNAFSGLPGNVILEIMPSDQVA